MEKNTNKKYYWKIDGRVYEVTKEQYIKYRKEQDRHYYLKKAEKAVQVISFDSLGKNGESGDSFLADESVDIESEVIHKMMLEKLRSALDKLSEEELLLIDLLYTKIKSEREIADIMGKSQCAINKKKVKVLERLKKLLEK